MLRFKTIGIALLWITALQFLPAKLAAQPLHNFAEGISESYQSKPKFIIGFDSRRSFISSRDVSIFGLRAGFDLAPKVRMGFGFYGLSTPFYRNFITYSDSTGLDTIQGRLQFGYMSMFWEYVILQNQRWEFSAPIHIGIGASEFKGVEKTRNPIGVTEISVQGQYKILTWFGLGAGVGYRVLMPKNVAVTENFNAPLYSIRMKVFLGELYDTVFKGKSSLIKHQD